MNSMVSPERRVVSRPIEDNRRKTAAALEIFPIGTILTASDRADGPVYHIHEGCIVHSRLTANGIAQVVDVYGPGRIFVHPSRPSLAEVRIECRYEVLNLRKHARMIHESLVENLDRSHRHVALLCGKTAVQRIATVLMDLALQFGVDPVSCGTLSLPLTRTEIGDWLGLRGETVSRVFSQLVQQRAISLDTNRRLCVKNWQALSLIADGVDRCTGRAMAI
ncbi:MAG: Crp/Fnr family transcriptional regulator [Hydrogenophaga sp.]|nr:Crp/Fnr family transcriptional regulator [Hydrogenophaga sp.]